MRGETGNYKITKILAFIIIFLLFSSISAKAISPYDEVIHEILSGDPEKVKHLLKDPNIVNIKDERGFTPLHVILSGGGDTDLYSVTYGRNNSTMKGIKLLISTKGADVNIKDNWGHTPLFYVNSKEIAELLISKGADVNEKDNKGKTPLFYIHSKEIAELLISKGAGINIKDKDGNPILDDAIYNHRSEEMLKLLIAKGADVNAKNKGGKTPLHYAAAFCDYNDIRLFRILLKSPGINIIKLLLDSGTDVNAKDNEGCTPLFNAFFYCEDRSVTDLLISRGADINAKDNRGWTILSHELNQLTMLRPNFASFEILEFLISRGADVNIKDNKGRRLFDINWPENVKKILILANVSGILHRHILIILPALIIFTAILSIILSKIIYRFKKK
jgi:ankyrin repeat protein